MTEVSSTRNPEAKCSGALTLRLDEDNVRSNPGYIFHQGVQQIEGFHIVSSSPSSAEKERLFLTVTRQFVSRSEHEHRRTAQSGSEHYRTFSVIVTHLIMNEDLSLCL